MTHPEVPVSPWVQRWSHLVARGASVLDVACGSGRHVRWFAQQGCRVTAVDRDAAALGALRSVAEGIVADLEGSPWPLPGRAFDAVVVTNYLWRELLPSIVGSLAPGGVLIYETFTLDQRSLGKPSNPAFLLRPGELLGAAKGLRIVAFEDGFESQPERFVQRIVAVNAAALVAQTARYRLDAGPTPERAVKSPDSEERP
ncbi:MAG: class I SAM-dependent methyltransferase [Burkholderiaceae bacterium]